MINWLEPGDGWVNLAVPGTRLLFLLGPDQNLIADRHWGDGEKVFDTERLSGCNWQLRMDRVDMIGPLIVYSNLKVVFIR